VITESSRTAADKIVSRGKFLGGFIYWYAFLFAIVQTVALIWVMKFIYDESAYRWYGKSKVDWDAVTPQWAASIGVWLFTLLLTAVLAVVGVLAQAQSKSLEFKIADTDS
jgi:hypothetical protein